MTVALRPYQERAIEHLRQHIGAGVRRLLLVAPTGAGKTTIAGHVIVSAIARGKRLLFVAHRRELIAQAYRRVIEMGVPEESVGIIMGQDRRRRPMAPVQVASIDTLRNRPKPSADIVIIDEAHRSLARSYVELAAFYASAVILGLTATPYRADGKGLGEMYQELVLVAQPRDLIADGFLVEPRVFTVPSGQLPQLDSVRVRGGDYDEAALARAVDRPQLVGNIVEHWLKYAGGIRTVAFAVSVVHSRHIVERFRDGGVVAEHLDGTTPVEERDAILGRLEQGSTTVVSNVGCLCEGWDMPSVKCAILARPTHSTTLYLQCAGRILRPWQGQRAIILDHGGCAVEHGLPQDDRECMLTTPEKRKRSGRDDGAASVRICEQCQAVMPPATRVCPECGFTLESGLPEEDAGELVEITRAPAAAPVVSARSNQDTKRAYYEKLLATESSQAWARARYRFELRERPPGET